MKRGELYWIDFGEGAGSEAEGERLGLVVSNDRLNSLVDTIVVLPTSSSDVRKKLRHKENILISKRIIPDIPQDCVAQGHLVRHVSRQRLVKELPVADNGEQIMNQVSLMLGELLETRNIMEDDFGDIG